MDECPVFNAFAAVESIWEEIDRLVTGVPQAFGGQGLQLAFKTEDSFEDWSCGRTGYHFEVRAANTRQRTSQFLLTFDMVRPMQRSTWVHAREALLTFAYAPRFDDGWEVEQVIIGVDGRLVDKEARAACERQANGKLLEWPESKTYWRDRSWLFSVPLVGIKDHVAFSREIVNPVVAMLKDNAAPDAVLGAGSSVVFAEH